MRCVFDFSCASALHVLFMCVCLNPQCGAVPDKSSPGTLSAHVEARVSRMNGLLWSAVRAV